MFLCGVFVDVARSCRVILKVQDASLVFPSLSVHAFWCACVCANNGTNLRLFQSSTQRPLQDAEMLGVKHAHINLPEDRSDCKTNRKNESAPLVKTSRTRACEIREKEAQILPPSFCLFGSKSVRLHSNEKDSIFSLVRHRLWGACRVQVTEQEFWCQGEAASFGRQSPPGTLLTQDLFPNAQGDRFVFFFFFRTVLQLPIHWCAPPFICLMVADRRLENPDRHKSCAPISSIFVRALVSTVIPNTNGTKGKD